MISKLSQAKAFRLCRHQHITDIIPITQCHRLSIPMRLLPWPSTVLGAARIYLYGRQCSRTGEVSDTAQWLLFATSPLASPVWLVWACQFGNSRQEVGRRKSRSLQDKPSPVLSLSRECLKGTWERHCLPWCGQPSHGSSDPQ